MKILVDGDSCPVLAVIEKAAKANLVPCHVYADMLRDMESEYSEIHFVESSRDSADFAIANAAAPGDIVVTNDAGLASMAMARGAFAMSPFGYQYTNRNIGSMLQRRYMHARVARSEKHAGKAHRAVASKQDVKREDVSRLVQRLVDESARRHHA